MLAPPDEPERPAIVYDPGIRYYAVCLAEQLHEGNNSRLRGPVLQLYILYQRYCTTQVPIINLVHTLKPLLVRSIDLVTSQYCAVTSEPALGG